MICSTKHHDFQKLSTSCLHKHFIPAVWQSGGEVVDLFCSSRTWTPCTHWVSRVLVCLPNYSNASCEVKLESHNMVMIPNTEANLQQNDWKWNEPSCCNNSVKVQTFNLIKMLWPWSRKTLKSIQTLKRSRWKEASTGMMRLLLFVVVLPLQHLEQTTDKECNGWHPNFEDTCFLRLY